MSTPVSRVRFRASGTHNASTRPHTAVLLSLALVFLSTAPLVAAPPPSGTDAAGRTLYAEHCAACHGDAADGRGTLAAGLSVPPADLVALAREHDAPWFFQRISEGWGQMHPQAHNLPEPLRWKIARYLTSLIR